ncbi:ABC transporter permease [bacterium]|nr:ABC transporter permease [bacterium]
MSRNYLYSFREGFIGLRRARLATFLCVSSIAVSLTLLSVFLLLTLNIQKMVRIFRDRMTFEVFVDQGTDESGIRGLQETLRSMEGIEKISYISRDAALETFRNEFGQDPLEIYGDNPLPASFQVKLSGPFMTQNRIRDRINAIQGLPGVDEVVFHDKLYHSIDRYSDLILVIDGVLFLIVLAAAILLVSNTIRLTIFAQRKNIEIMELVGATRGFIRRPYLIQGLIQGGIGGCIASCVAWILVFILHSRLPNLLYIPAPWFLVPVILGLVLGYLGSWIGLKKFLS